MTAAASSMVGLLESGRFRRDPKSRSLSFFCTDPTVEVDDRLIDELIAQSERTGRCNARICLHASPEADFHEMVILEREGFYYPPHRHATKGESCHIIRGELAVFAFDDAGRVARFRVLGRDGNVMFRVSTGQWHSVLPLTDVVVYHEAKPGPFLGANDSQFAAWAPDRNDQDAVRAYLDKLRRLAQPTVALAG